MLSQRTPPELVEQERQLVQRLTGASAADQVVLNDGGWTSRVYIVNRGQFVVKFPRGEAVKEEYAAEISMLALLARIETAVQAPRLRWLHPDNAYLGYEGIVGDEFAPLVAHANADTKRSVGRAIGDFLKQLHAQRLQGARVISTEDEIEALQFKHALSSSVIARDFSEDAQAKLAWLVREQIPRELRRLGEDPALCHGDLGFWNMVLKRDGQIGIIDFGDAGYFDRSKDFMGLRDTAVLDAALELYGDDDVLRRKIAVRQDMLYLLDLPFFIGKEDAAGVGQTVAKIKAMLGTAGT